MLSVIKLLRPHHCIKNFLLFLPLVFSGNLFNITLLQKAVFGFFAFTFISGAVYVINDIRDAEKDRAHPVKCKRPVACGKVSKKAASFVAATAVLLSLIFNFLSGADILTTGLLLMYFILNMAYSFGLKSVPMVDIIILVSGFLLRVIYGSYLCEIPVSNWLYLTVISVSFYLGLGKRRGELQKSGEVSRKVLKYYTYSFLDKNMYISNALFLIFYALWCTGEDISMRFSNKMIWTVPLVMIISMKYSLDVENSCDADPVEVLVSDKFLIFLAALYAVVVLLIIYGAGFGL